MARMSGGGRGRDADDERRRWKAFDADDDPRRIRVGQSNPSASDRRVARGGGGRGAPERARGGDTERRCGGLHRERACVWTGERERSRGVDARREVSTSFAPQESSRKVFLNPTRCTLLYPKPPAPARTLAPNKPY